MIKVVIAVAGLMVLALGVLVVVFVGRAWLGRPFEVLGIGAAPTQPIAFPHDKHAGLGENQAGINCLFCHRNVTDGKAATVPAVEQCMFCHKVITGTGSPNEVSPEIAKLRQYWDSKQPINWERVYRLPDHVRFSHEPHLTYFTQYAAQPMEAAQVCALCHGPVDTMPVVQQLPSAPEGGALKMGDCVNCHRKYSAPTDCVMCHY